MPPERRAGRATTPFVWRQRDGPAGKLACKKASRVVLRLQAAGRRARRVGQCGQTEAGCTAGEQARETRAKRAANKWRCKCALGSTDLAHSSALLGHTAALQVGQCALDAQAQRPQAEAPRPLRQRHWWALQGAFAARVCPLGAARFEPLAWRARRALAAIWPPTGKLETVSRRPMRAICRRPCRRPPIDWPARPPTRGGRLVSSGKPSLGELLRPSRKPAVKLPRRRRAQLTKCQVLERHQSTGPLARLAATFWCLSAPLWPTTVTDREQTSAGSRRQRATATSNCNCTQL